MYSGVRAHKYTHTHSPKSKRKEEWKAKKRKIITEWKEKRWKIQRSSSEPNGIYLRYAHNV